MKTPKKLTALVLAGAVASSSLLAVPASAKTFTDVPVNHWAYDVINEVSDKHIMVGVGENIFSPSSTLTRAEYTAILANLSPDLDNGSFSGHYTDVPANAWYAESVEWVVTNGIIEIGSDGLFKPNEPMTRELMADMTYKFAYYKYTSQIINNVTSAGYADQDQIDDKYEKSVNVLTHNGLMAGRGDNKFEPKGTLTRAEAAAMASRLLDIKEKAGEDNPPVDPPTDPDEPEQPPVDPEEPEQPPTDPEEPENPSTDPSDPSNWDLDGAPEWFLVGQPDNITDEQWEKMITYYADKERPKNSGYPSSINSLPASCRNDEEAAKAYCGTWMEGLYDIMQLDLADQAMAADGEADITADELKMIDMVNEERRKVGAPELIVSPALCRAADIRAKEALVSEPHRRPDGSDCAYVLEDDEVGLSYLFYNGTTNAIYMAENQTLGIRDPRYSVSLAMSNFMKSEGHKNNLLRDTHKYIGIGFYSNGKDSAWIQIFGRTQ